MKGKMANKVRYITRLDQIDKLSDQEKRTLRPVAEKFVFKTNDYYTSLIDWDDPDDPIRRVIIPHRRELEMGGSFDPSNEQAFTVLPGLEHKYGSTALMIVSDTCDGICRYCFRKRVFQGSSDERVKDISDVIEYIKEHTEITNVLLTGGDPLCLATDRLTEIVSALRDIEHVEIIRIGSKVPVFNPYMIIENESFLEMIEKYSLPQKKIYIMTHFSHPRELTDVAAKAITMMQKAGAIITNQCPLIRGVNDNPDVLAELLRKVSFAGAAPYYIFQCRPTIGNEAYIVPVEEAYDIVQLAKQQVSGLAKRFKFVMSHSTGKIEIIGKTDELIYFRYHRAHDEKNNCRLFAFRLNPDAAWFDDYDEPVEDCRIDMTSHSCQWS